MSQETQTGALYQPREVGLGGRWEGGSKGRGYNVSQWLIHVEVWHKTIKFCKAIIVHLKKKDVHCSISYSGLKKRERKKQSKCSITENNQINCSISTQLFKIM